MFTFSYPVAFADVDAAGIIYYPRHFHICHLALEHMVNQSGFTTYPELIYKRKIGLPIIHVQAHYKAPIFYGDTITVELMVESIKTSSIRTQYRFLKSDEHECFLATITTVCLDLETKKPLAVPSDLRGFLLNLSFA